jgi:adenylate cyclase
MLGRLDARGEEFRRLAQLNAAMLAAYRERRWQECLETILLCREAGRAFGLEAFYQLYVERVRALIEAPPEASWDGVWVAAEK